MAGISGWVVAALVACSASAGVVATGPSSPTALVQAAAFDPAQCGSATPTQGTVRAGDPRVREVAQKGLTFLESSASSWATGHECFGCHVHAVTVEALSVGTHHGYDVNERLLASFVAAMTTGPGGTRSPGGLNYAHGGSLVAASHGFGGSALARYDALVSTENRSDLRSTARELLQWQAEDGGVRDPEAWVNLPVGTGRIQLTAQALSTWRRAYEADADEAWLGPIARGEQWLRAQLAAMDPATGDLQPLDYALLGLAEAGGKVSEGAVGDLVGAITRRQNEDGGFSTTAGAASDALATGQVLYTLRQLGLTDADPAVARGTAWLVRNQQPGGGWRSGGFEKAEAMWAVLGLVSVDVLSLRVDGLTDGQHVEGAVPLHAVATSNRGRGVRSVELRVDDRRWTGACGGDLATTWDTASLSAGRHLVEVTAVDGDGKTARRRIEVYAGEHWMTQLGTRWSDGGTLLSLRNLAPEGAGRLRVEVVKDGAVVFTESAEARPGPNTFFYGGADTVGARLTARLAFLAPDGRVVQQEELPFVHADPAAQRASYGDVAGRVQLGGGAGSANTAVELLDDQGRVVQRVGTTADGNYRFKNVDAAAYKVRVVKAGFAAQEVDVEAKAGEDAAPAPITATEQE